MTGLAGTSISRSSTSEYQGASPIQPVPCPLLGKKGSDLDCPPLVLSPQPLPHHAPTQLSQGGPPGEVPVCQAWHRVPGEATAQGPPGHRQVPERVRRAVAGCLPAQMKQQTWGTEQWVPQGGGLWPQGYMGPADTGLVSLLSSLLPFFPLHPAPCLGLREAQVCG